MDRQLIMGGVQPVRRLPVRAVLSTVTVLVAACTANPPSPPAAPAATPSPALASPTTAVTDVLAGCPAARDLASLAPLARIPGDDDDIAAGPGGGVWLSEPAGGRLIELTSAGAVVRSFVDPDGPEGIAFAADGRMFLAHQRTNHVDVVDPQTGGRTLFASFPGATGLDVGIDGIAVDTAHARLLVPDSPLGTLLAVPLSGGAATTLARNLGRPVSAAALADGSVLVAEENAPGLVRVDSSGRVTPVVTAGALKSVDEVQASSGAVYVADLLAGTVDAVDPRTARLRVLVSGAPAPQGLVQLSGGRLLMTDPVRHEVAALRSC